MINISGAYKCPELLRGTSEVDKSVWEDIKKILPSLTFADIKLTLGN